MNPDSLMSGIVNVYNFRSWLNAILAVPKGSFESRASIYIRALSHLPGSYKLWYNLLKEARSFVKQFSIIDQQQYYEAVNELHERCLTQYMFSMPKMWIDYAKFL